MNSRIVTLLSALVGINSINSTLSRGPGESEIAQFIQQHLAGLKLKVEMHTIAPGRCNLVALIPGIRRSKSLLLNGHLDTVGVEGMADPFTLRQQGDKLYGRGAYDMKGSLAVMLLLAEHLARHPPPEDVWLVFTADEEDKSIGMEHFVASRLPGMSPAPEAAIILEPTELQIGTCHKGFAWHEIEISGKAAHGSRPAEGVDAILPLKAALEQLSCIQAELLARPPDPLLGHATLHAAMISGGSELSMISARSKLQWERRTLPAEPHQKLDAELDRVIQAVRAQPGNHAVSGRIFFARNPYRVADDANIVKHLQKAAPQSERVGLSFWADSGLLGTTGIDCVLFGPVGHGAHATDEWVSLKSLVRIYEVLKQLIRDY